MKNTVTVIKEGLTLQIVLLAWGSLVWNPGDLKIKGGWQEKGPLLPLEFARKSSGGRLTLVLFPGAKKIETFWALLESDNLQEVICDLAKRENTSSKNISYILTRGRKNIGADKAGAVPIIRSWARMRNVDAVVWTNLQPSFKSSFTSQEAIDYLRNLDASDIHNAEMYIRRAPAKIKTRIRSEIERTLGWYHCSAQIEQDWTPFKEAFAGRVIHRSRDNSVWAVVPDRPASFGHVMIVSWKSIRENDISDEGLFINSTHFQEIMLVAHNLAFQMKAHLTSNGESTGKKCTKVYMVSECETEHFPFHIHLYPRFGRDNKGNLFLLEKELEEARWLTSGQVEGQYDEGTSRIRKAKAVLKHQKMLIQSKEWVRSNETRQEFVQKITDWWKNYEFISTD
ncbi:MAG: hypothetical protein ABSF44_09475 [Candidatus Bathyarchaeia archaeon]